MPERIGALDFGRGVAVLGILAINVTGFWGPLLATFSPAMPRLEPGGAVWFITAYVLFEGKMRGLFTLLFGASMMLFADAAERRGANPDPMQVRRLSPPRAFAPPHYPPPSWGRTPPPAAVAAPPPPPPRPCRPRRGGAPYRRPRRRRAQGRPQAPRPQAGQGADRRAVRRGRRRREGRGGGAAGAAAGDGDGGEGD